MVLKQDIINELAKKGYTKKDAGILLDDVLEIITNSLIEGNEVHLHGFGNFEIINIKAHEGYDVVQRKTVVVPEHKRIKFTLGTAMKRALREGFWRE